MGHAFTVCVVVPEAQQGAGKGVAGAKAETVESGATTEELKKKGEALWQS
jgi:hypothetical protein